MGARAKLNAAYFHGSLLLAALLGLLVQSWPLFILALIVLLISNLYSGEIRPDPHMRGQKTKKTRRGEKA